MVERESVEGRLAALEARIAAIEARSGPLPPVPPVLEPTTPAAQPVPEPTGGRIEGFPPIRIAQPPASPDSVFRLPRVSAALVLGWAGAAVLVLAAAYLVRLGIEYGWITPARQILATAALGVGMIAGGLALRPGDRPYASLLAAGGVAVLYLAVFGAHLVHHLIGAPAAMALAVAIAAISLVLHAVYRSSVYVAFALAGSYVTPLLVEGTGTVTDVALYLGVWDIVYCAYGIWIGRRIVVVSALYASLVVFDIGWSEVGRDGWEIAALFQLFQFVLFVTVAVVIAIRSRRPMGPAGIVLQFPALLLFYAVEYAILDAHVPQIAPWAAVAFAVALYAAWGVAGWRLPARPRASLVGIHAFGGLVLYHAVYFDATPQEWRPLVALAIAAALMALPQLRPAFRAGWWPYWVAAALLVLAGWLELALAWKQEPFVAEAALALLYPGAFYALYFKRPVDSDPWPRMMLLAVAHVLALAGTVLLVERWFGPGVSTVDRLWLSLAWAGIGVVTLLAAFARKDRLLARSTLAIFLLFGAKVLLIDLGRAAPLVRVGILAVLGLSLYAGGWIYRRVLPPERGGIA